MDDGDADGFTGALSAQARREALARRLAEHDTSSRRPGPGPYVRGLRREPLAWGTGHPFDVPALAGADAIDLDAPITLLTGDNGTGKSTFVEALAEAMGFALTGGELERAGENPPRPRTVLDGCLRPVLTRTKPAGGYFLRAESFFGIAESVDAGGTFAPDISLYGGVPLHGQSHGQSFLALASNRFGGDGLYLLDEPEAALSFSGLLALLAVMTRAADAGAQLVVATHSPVLLACPGARIYELDEDGVRECAYDELESVRLLRAFLDAPERFLRAALDPD